MYLCIKVYAKFISNLQPHKNRNVASSIQSVGTYYTHVDMYL